MKKRTVFVVYRDCAANKVLGVFARKADAEKARDRDWDRWVQTFPNMGVYYSIERKTIR